MIILKMQSARCEMNFFYGHFVPNIPQWPEHSSHANPHNSAHSARQALRDSGEVPSPQTKMNIISNQIWQSLLGKIIKKKNKQTMKWYSPVVVCGSSTAFLRSKLREWERWITFRLSRLPWVSSHKKKNWHLLTRIAHFNSSFIIMKN
jgi:hypothetical protein